MLKLAGEFIEGQLADHKAKLDAHTRNPMELMRTGQYAFALPVESKGTTQLVANTLYAIPFLVARPITVDRIAVYVSTLADPSNIRLGIYENGTNLYPGALVLDAGTVSGATTGLKAIIIDPAQALSKGLYWLAAVSDATPTIYMMKWAWTPLGWQSSLYDAQDKWITNFTYAALPDPFTSGGSGGWGGLNISCRVASLA